MDDPRAILALCGVFWSAFGLGMDPERWQVEIAAPSWLEHGWKPLAVREVLVSQVGVTLPARVCCA